MPFELMPVIEGGQSCGCLNCGATKTQLCGDSRIAVGFGAAYLSRDDETVWYEAGQEWEECMTVSEAESLARADPDHDWRIVLHGPLRGATYQRQAEATWLLIETNMGFA